MLSKELKAYLSPLLKTREMKKSEQIVVRN